MPSEEDIFTEEQGIVSDDLDMGQLEGEVPIADSGPSPKTPNMLGGSNDINYEEFDPETNQLDMQTIQQAVPMTAMLRKVPEGKRGDIWPTVYNRLAAKNPKVMALLNSEVPPTNEELDQLLPKEFTNKIPMEEEEEEEEVGEVAHTSAAPLDKVMRRKVQEKLVELDANLGVLDEIAHQFDPKDFTYRRKFMAKFSAMQEKAELGLLSPAEQDMYGAHKARMNRIQRFALMWRKYITGVAGGEKEMKTIMDSILNKDLSASEARHELSNLITKAMRDRTVHRNLLKRGILAENLPPDVYTDIFKKERQKVMQDFNNYYGKFLKVNKGRYKIRPLQSEVWMYRERNKAARRDK